jgi:hypothetical protein
MAKEHCTMPRISQLQHVSSSGSFGGSRGRGNANGPSQIAPIIVYEEEQDGRLPPQQSVDKREAARLAYWSRPELSCEGLSMVRANGNGGGFPNQPPPPFEPAQMPPMIVEPDVEVGNGHNGFNIANLFKILRKPNFYIIIKCIHFP